MLISDWSSDVCSSDLTGLRDCQPPLALEPGNQHFAQAVQVANVAGGIVALRIVDQRPAPVAQLLLLRDILAQQLLDQVLEPVAIRSEERRVGKDSVSKGRSRWSPSP